MRDFTFWVALALCAAFSAGPAGTAAAAEEGGITISVASGYPDPSPAFFCQEVECEFSQDFDWSDPRVQREVNKKTSLIKQRVVLAYGEKAEDKGSIEEVEFLGKTFRRDATWRRFRVTFQENRRKVLIEQLEYEAFGTLIRGLWSEGRFHSTGDKKITMDTEVLVMTPGVGGPFRFTGSRAAAVAVNPPVVQVDAEIYAESGRRIENIAGQTINTVASGWVRFVADVTEVSGVDWRYEWQFAGGTPDRRDLAKDKCDWDAPDTETACKVKLIVRCPHNEKAGEADVTVNPVRPRVVRVKFVDDSGNEEQQIEDGGDPEYDEVAGHIFPICYVMGRGMRVQVDVSGSKNLSKRTEIRITAKASYGGLLNPFDATDNLDAKTVDWSQPDYDEVVIQSDRNVPNHVAEFEDFEMQWTFLVRSWRGGRVKSYTAGGGADYSHKTDHVRDAGGGEKYGLFLIYDVEQAAAGDFTMKHINYACETAHGQRNTRHIADAIGPDATGAHFDFANTYHGSMAWKIIDNAVGADCGSVAWLMRNALDLLGVTGAEVRYVRACHADWSHLWNTDPAHSTGESNPITGALLIMWFGGPDSLNYYEGCCHFQGKWWRAGYGDHRRSAKEVLHSVCDPNVDGEANPHQAWENDLFKAIPYPRR